MGMFGPNAAGIPQSMRQAPAERSFLQLPQQPQSQEIAGTIEHLTGRPADPAEVQQFMGELEVTYGDYSPGGETARGSNSGNMAIR